MLRELRVQNLLLIERAELRLGAGLNVLTGETGAGKTMLAHALDLLLGGKGRAGLVRPGAAEAYVEGVFALPDELRGDERLAAAGDEFADEVVLARRLTPEGRGRALVDGRTATLADLHRLGSALVAFYGQHEHRKLTIASAQLDLLDAFCGAGHREERRGAAVAHGRLRAAEARLAELRDRAGARDREVDLLAFELREIEEAAPSEAEEAELTADRQRLRHVEALRGAALGAGEALAGEHGAAELAAAQERALDAVAGVDAALDPLVERFRGLVVEARELGGDLRRYGEAVEAEPGRLEQVDERLAQLDRLRRKHGGSIADVLAHAERCRARLAELEGAEEALEEAGAEADRARAELAERCAALRRARLESAPRLREGVVARLADLAMEGADFRVALSEREPGPTGADAVELVLAPNAGVPGAPLRETASGGELSRVMLALLGTVNAEGDQTLVFDEVDAGIGGQTARAVGEQLRGLAAGRQVLCITHLPQIASLADRHFAIEKDPGADPARTTVRHLGDARAVEGELVRMLGAGEGDAAARRHARELRKAA